MNVLAIIQMELLRSSANLWPNDKAESMPRFASTTPILISCLPVFLVLLHPNQRNQVPYVPHRLPHSLLVLLQLQPRLLPFCVLLGPPLFPRLASPVPPG